MRSAALVQLVNSALETLRRKEMAPLWHRLAVKNTISQRVKPATKYDPHALATALARKEVLAAAQHAVAAKKKVAYM